MDEVANVSRSRRRRVRCPTCQQLLVEPPGNPPIYQCIFCSSFLLAKGVPPDFQGELWQTPMNEDNQGTENGQQTSEQEPMSIDGSELIGSQNQLDHHEINEHLSIDGDIRQQEQLSTENGSVVENKREQELQLEDDCENTSTLAGDNDLSAEYASKNSITNSEEAMAIDGSEFIGSQNQLDDHEINEHVSIDVDIRQQEQLSTENGSVVENKREQELELEDCCENTSTLAGDNDLSAEYASKSSITNSEEAMAIDGSELIGSQNQLDDHEINEHVSIDGDIRQQEQLSTENGSVVENKREQELQLEDDCENTSTLAGDNDLSAEDASRSSITNSEEAMAVDREEREGAPVSNSRASPETHSLLDHTIPQLPLKDAENCSMPSSGEEKKKFVGEGECDTVGEGVELNLLSEISRDSESELSFKYISSALESNDQLAPRKGTSRLSKLSSEGSGRSCEMPSKPLNAQLTERRPLSSEENSDDYESYSSASESASDESSDSEFDFPSPSAQSLQPPNLSDSLFQQKMPLPDLPSDALPKPHQLEWQEVDHENAEIALPNSNGTLPTPHQLEWQDIDQKSEGIPLQNSKAAVTSSGEVDATTAYDVLNAVDQGDQVERAESEKHLLERHLQKDAVDQREQKVGLEDTEVVVREFFHVQGESTGLIGGPANIVGSFDSIESDNAETEEGSNGFQESVSQQLNKHRAMLNIYLQGVSGSLDLLSSGAEHPSQLKSGATLKEGITSARTLISGTEAPLCSVSDGSELANSLATHENIKLVHSVANVKLEDSAATIASKIAVHTGKASQSSTTSHMICVEKIQEGSSDPLRPQQKMLLSDANNQSWGASTSGDMPTKRDVKGAYAAHNLEPKSMGVQTFPLVTEQGYSSSHSAESQLYYGRDYSSEGVHGVNRAAAVNMFDSRLHHRRIYSEETQAQSECSHKYAPQVQKNMHNEGPHGSRSKKILEGSSRMHHRHVEAAFELAGGQGPWQQQKQNHQADIHMMQHSMNYSGPSNGFPLGNLQSFGSNYYANGSDPFARGVPNGSLALTYRAPPHSWMLPVLPGIHYGCHSAASGHMACMHCQHSHLPQLPMPPCGLCFNQPLPLAHQQGHMGWCNPHQAHQIRGSDLQAPGVCSSPPFYPPQTVHIHDVAIARRKPHVSSARKPKHYPPLIRGNTAPYIICKRCDEVLEVPTDIPYSDTTAQKVRCGHCNKVAKFSVIDDSWATINAAQESTTTHKVSVSTSHAIQYNEKSRQPPVSNVVQSMDSSYLQGIINSGLHPPVKQGSFGSQQQISAASKRRGSVSLDEIVQSPKCERDASDQDEFFFRSLSRYSEFDSSRIFFNGFKASSSAVEASNFDGLLGGDVMHLQTPVDEKEEGLDFGAPRMSDGESLGQRSPESRMRSPENKQHFQLLDMRRRTNGSLKDVEDAAFALKKKTIAEGKKPATSLFALLNQESSKFDIDMVERDSFDDARTVWFSTSSNSPMDDEYASKRHDAGGYGTFQSCKAASKRSGRKGPMYVVGMLRRSLKDFSRGKQ